MRTSRTESNRRRKAYVRALAERGIELHFDGSGTWASTPDGRSVPIRIATDTQGPGKWWFDFDPLWFEGDDALPGAIFLCCSEDGSLIDFGLPAAQMRGFALRGYRAAGKKRLRDFNLVRRRGQYFLQVTGSEFDITGRLGDLSWLAARPESAPPTGAAGRAHATSSTAAGAARAAEAASSYAGQRGGDRGEISCFARVEAGVLRPLDPIEIPEGMIVHVVATPSPAVPANSALRRIAARGVGSALPSDFAIHHDHYAHGAAKR